MRFVRGCHKFDCDHVGPRDPQPQMAFHSREKNAASRAVCVKKMPWAMSCRGRVEEPAKVVQSPPGGVGSADVSHISPRELSLAFCRWLYCSPPRSGLCYDTRCLHDIQITSYGIYYNIVLDSAYGQVRIVERTHDGKGQGLDARTGPFIPAGPCDGIKYDDCT